MMECLRAVIFLMPAQFLLFLTLLAINYGSAQTNYNTIQSKLLPQTTGTTPLYFKMPNIPTSEQFIQARVRALRTTVDPNYTYGYITYSG